MCVYFCCGCETELGPICRKKCELESERQYIRVGRSRGVCGYVCMCVCTPMCYCFLFLEVVSVGESVLLYAKL